jgi:hypothetical protein
MWYCVRQQTMVIIQYLKLFARVERCQVFFLILWNNYPIAVLGGLVIWLFFQSLHAAVTWVLACLLGTLFIAASV